MPMTYAESNYCAMPAAHVCSGEEEGCAFLKFIMGNIQNVILCEVQIFYTLTYSL